MTRTMSQQPNGIHHIAFMAADIKTHIAFFSEVLGFPLVALFDMHGVPGGLHAFLRMNDYGYFSIVQLPDVDKIPIEIGRTHAGSGALPSAAGTMQHLAFRAGSDAELLALRDRVRSHGINVIGPIDHGMCRSIYFAGPDHLTLEIATSTEPIQAERWIDPTVCAKAGISAEEAARFAAPTPYEGPSPVPQPEYDPQKPHMVFPEKAYRKMLATPDDVITKNASYAEPPIRRAS